MRSPSEACSPVDSEKQCARGQRQQHGAVPAAVIPAIQNGAANAAEQREGGIQKKQLCVKNTAVVKAGHPEAQKIFQSVKADRHTEQIQKCVQESAPMRNAVHCDHADADDPEAKERCNRRKTPQTLIGAKIRKSAKNPCQNAGKEEGHAAMSVIGQFHLQYPRDRHG